MSASLQKLVNCCAAVERLDKLRSRAKQVGWGVEDELNDVGHAVDFDEQLEMNNDSLHVPGLKRTLPVRAAKPCSKDLNGSAWPQ